MLFTVIVTVSPKTWKVNVIGMVSPPFGKCGQPPAVVCSALPPKRQFQCIIFRHDAQGSAAANTMTLSPAAMLRGYFCTLKQPYTSYKSYAKYNRYTAFYFVYFTTNTKLYGLILNTVRSCTVCTKNTICMVIL